MDFCHNAAGEENRSGGKPWGTPLARVFFDFACRAARKPALRQTLGEAIGQVFFGCYTLITAYSTTTYHLAAQTGFSPRA